MTNRPAKRIVFLHGVGGNGASMHSLADQLSPGFEGHHADGPQPLGLRHGWPSFYPRAGRKARAAAMSCHRGISATGAGSRPASPKPVTAKSARTFAQDPAPHPPIGNGL